MNKGPSRSMKRALMEQASTPGELRGLEEEGSGFSSRDSPGEMTGVEYTQTKHVNLINR